MDRQTALDLLKEIQEKVPELAPQEISLQENKQDYHLHFKGLCRDYKERVVKIANEHNLCIQEQENELTI